MSMLRQEHIADPSSNDTQVLKVTPRVPLEIGNIVDISNILRQSHQGIIAFAKGSLRTGALGQARIEATGVSKNGGSAGWHMHGGMYAMNLSRGSSIPTLFARPEDVSQAIRDSIYAHIPELLELDRAIDPFPMNVLNLDEKVVEGPPRRLIEYIHRVTEELTKRKEEATLEGTSQAWNTLRTLLLTFNDADPRLQVFHKVFFAIIRESQMKVQPERVLTLAPRDYDAYVIPPYRTHARSV